MIAVQTVTHDSIELGRITKAFQDHVPGVFIRDYRHNGGWITIARGYITTWDKSKNTDKFSTALPAQTLCCLPAGMVTKKSRYRKRVLIRPGWEKQMRLASRFMTEHQMRAIDRQIGVPLFRRAGCL